jgi:RNA polymerase sigma-70 factor (ECF subfamily)
MGDAQRGDATAYAELLNEIGPMMMKFLRRRVRNADETQDVYQDVFMALHRARHTYDPTRPLEPWLFAIARRVVTDHEQQRIARREREVLADSPREAVVEGDGYLKPQLEQALLALSPDQREAIDLLRVQGLPVAAAARRAGTSAVALKVRAHRAYRILRQLL